MDKASKALRRSSVRLRSIGSGHGELNLVISELKEMRNTAKAFLTAQQSASQELLRWSQVDENRAIQETFLFINELNVLWADVQKDFTDHLKDFKTQFELILEGEKHVDQARTAVALCDQRETKLKKDLKKCIKKGSAEEVHELEKRMVEAVRVREVACMEVDDRVRENEAVKLIRVKESLMKLSESYVDLSNNCKIIFEAQKKIANQLPDVHGKDLQDIRYTGHDVSKQVLARAKESLHECRRRSHNFAPCAPQPEDPPPPYSVCPPFNPAFHSSRNAAPSSYGGPGPSTSYDVTDGPTCSASASHAPQHNITQQGSSNSSNNKRRKRRGLFFRTSFRQTSTQDSAGDTNNGSSSSASCRPRSTNPFEEEINDRCQGRTTSSSCCTNLSEQFNETRIS